jgi:hypothetical protein
LEMIMAAQMEDDRWHKLVFEPRKWVEQSIKNSRIRFRGYTAGRCASCK